MEWTRFRGQCPRKRKKSKEWECWAHGSGLYAGMGGLVSAVRSTGARNVILAADLGWSADDSPWLKHEPPDPIHQLAATFHVYRGHTLCTTEACWTRTLLPVAEKVPLIDAEFGEMQCGEPASLAWLNQWMTYANIHGFSMLAWSWSAKQGACSEGPLLIENYEGAPTPYGSEVRAFFLAHNLSH